MPDIDGNVIALDMDGRALINLGMSRFGGLIRGHSGNFLKGIYGSVGYSDIVAELMALFHGSSLCWELGF